MHHHYRDITDRIEEPPSWWDENGTPRYGKFTPDQSANVYVDQVVLLEIACQACCTKFKVCMSSGSMDRIRHNTEGLKEAVGAGYIHYGDPPNSGCCAAGATMNCDDLRVLEFHVMEDRAWDWVRVPELEVELEDRYGMRD